MANKLGVVTFELRPEKPIRRISQLFDSGEIWGIEGLSDHALEKRFVPLPYLVNVFRAMMRNYIDFMRDQLHLAPPVKIVAGVSGVEGFSIADMRFMPSNMGGFCPKDEVLFEAILPSFDADTETEVITPFFQKVWEEFSLPGSWK